MLPAPTAAPEEEEPEDEDAHPSPTAGMQEPEVDGTPDGPPQVQTPPTTDPEVTGVPVPREVLDVRRCCAKPYVPLRGGIPDQQWFAQKQYEARASKIISLAAGMRHNDVRNRQGAFTMTVEILHSLLSAADRDQLEYCIAEDRGRAYFAGLGTWSGPDPRGDFLRPTEVRRPDAGTNPAGPNVEVWRVVVPSASDTLEFESVNIFKKISPRNGKDGILGKPYDPLFQVEDYERFHRHPSRDTPEHSGGSLCDWIWCEECDERCARDRETFGETCYHCAFLLTKALRTYNRDGPPRMYHGERLLEGYDLYGDKIEPDAFPAIRDPDDVPASQIAPERDPGPRSPQPGPGPPELLRGRPEGPAAVQ